MAVRWLKNWLTKVATFLLSFIKAFRIILKTVNIVGPLCTPLDILADKVQLPKAEIGDFVAVYQSGAYGYTASPHQFLSQPECVEVIL